MEKEEVRYLLFVHLGCLAKVNVPINNKRKLGPKTIDYVFLGYASTTLDIVLNYKLWSTGHVGWYYYGVQICYVF
jgi:hypothetical protein